MPQNSAAWFVAKGARLEVKAAPYTAPGEGEIVVRNRAVAINPVDWAIPVVGHLMFPWIKPPTVIGSDVAGEVAEVGPGVTRFEVGDRVVGYALGLNKNRNRAAEGAFQIYSVLSAHMVSPIPDALTFEQAAVLPLGLSTAACGLFQKDFLALAHPSADATPTGKTVLIWGGATSVGCNAIQLAAAAGYEVFTTASPRNFDYLRSLGAAQVFDYHAANVVKDIVAALKGGSLAGALAIATGSTGPCLDVVHACPGDKFVAIAGAPVALAEFTSGGLPRVLPKMIASTLSTALKSRVRGIRTKFIFGGALADNEVGPAVWVDFLPRALADGRYLAAPPALIAGAGLDAIETAFDVQRKGMSAQKVVVTL